MFEDIPPSEVSNTPYDMEYRYDIQWMYNTYSTGCSVDEFLGWIMLLRAKSIYFGKIGQLNKEAQFKKYAYDLINMRNSSEDSIKSNNMETIGTIKETI